MTSCTSPAPVGELGDVSRRLRALERWWRPEQAGHLRKLLEEAAALPERQADAAEALRLAEDARARLAPGNVPQDLWRHEQGAVTRHRHETVNLRAEEVALLSELETELWWARLRKLKDGLGIQVIKPA